MNNIAKLYPNTRYIMPLGERCYWITYEKDSSYVSLVYDCSVMDALPCRLTTPNLAMAIDESKRVDASATGIF